MNNPKKMEVVLVFEKRPLKIPVTFDGEGENGEPTCPMAVSFGCLRVRFVIVKTLAVGLQDAAIRTIEASGLVAANEHVTITSTDQEFRVTAKLEIPEHKPNPEPTKVLKVLKKNLRRVQNKRPKSDIVCCRQEALVVWIGEQRTILWLEPQVVNNIWKVAYRAQKPKK